MFGGPAFSWISAWNELDVTSSTTDPTEVAASLVFVVQSPWTGLFVPNGTVWPVAGTEVDAEVDVEGAAVCRLLEQPGTNAKVATSTTEGTAMDRRDDEGRMRVIFCGSLGAHQGLSDHKTQGPGTRVLLECQRSFAAHGDSTGVCHIAARGAVRGPPAHVRLAQRRTSTTIS